MELETGETETLRNNEHGRKQAVNVVCLCVFVPVCVSRDSQWGQRVSVAPCVAYKLIKDNQGWGKCTPLPTFCEYVRVVFRVRGKKKKKSAGDPRGLRFETSPGKWFTDCDRKLR